MKKFTKILESLLEEDAYDKYFKGMLKKYKIKDPSELKGAQKKKFFNDVDKGYKAKNETDKGNIMNYTDVIDERELTDFALKDNYNNLSKTINKLMQNLKNEMKKTSKSEISQGQIDGLAKVREAISNIL